MDAEQPFALTETERQIIGCLRESGRATAHEISSALDLDYRTVRRSLGQLLETNTVRITALADPTLTGHSVVAFLWLQSQSLENDLAAQLAGVTDVHWAATTVERTTAVVQLSCDSTSRFLEHLDSFRRWPDVVDVRSAIVLRSYIGPQSATMLRRNSQDPSRAGTLWLGGEIRAPLDQFDQQILEILRHDGRATLTHIAELTKLPLSTARRRLTKLLDSDGVRLQCRVSPIALGYRYHAGVSIRVRDDAAGLARTLSSLPAAAWVSEITGTFAVTIELFAIDQSEINDVLQTLHADARVSSFHVDYYAQNVKNTGLW